MTVLPVGSGLVGNPVTVLPLVELEGPKMMVPSGAVIVTMIKFTLVVPVGTVTSVMIAIAPG